MRHEYYIDMSVDKHHIRDVNLAHLETRKWILELVTQRSTNIFGLNTFFEQLYFSGLSNFEVLTEHKKSNRTT